MTAARRHTPLARSCPAPHPCPKSLRLRMLRRTPLFERLPDRDLEAVDAQCTARGYPTGAPIYRAGTPARSLYVLAEGRVKITRPTSSGAGVVVDLVLPGQSFGALPLLSQRLHEDTAETLTVSCALAISAGNVDRLVRTHPQIALAMIGSLADALAGARRTIERMSADSVEQRLAATLLALAERTGHDRAEGTVLQLPLTRSDLAGMTGARPESVSRTLSRWRRAGLIDSGRRWIAIRDRRALEGIAR